MLRFQQGNTKVRLCSRLHWREEKRKEWSAKLDWCCDCFCRDCYSWQGHLKSVRAPGDLEESSAWFSLRIHFHLGGWRDVQVHDCWFTSWPFSGTHPLLSPHIKWTSRLQQCFHSCLQRSPHLCVHLSTEQCYHGLQRSLDSGHWTSCTVYHTYRAWHRPWALDSVAKKWWFIATATRWAVLVNWALEQLAEASGVLGLVWDIFSLCGLCSHGLQVVFVCNIDPSVWKACTENSQHETVASWLHIQLQTLLLEKLIKESCGGTCFYSWLFLFPKGQDGCHLSSTLSQKFCPKSQ